jgi:hypothetical protein
MLRMTIMKNALHRFRLFTILSLLPITLVHATYSTCTTKLCECVYGGNMDNGGIICNAQPSAADTHCTNKEDANLKTTCGSWCNSLETKSKCESG